METVKIIREKKQPSPGVQTIGRMYYKDKQICVTLELPWKENKNRISCIPKGTYKVVERTSPKYGLHFHVTDVPGRSLILIHNANYVTDLLGCIGVGSEFTFINKDAHLDITNSRKTMAMLLKDLPKEFNLIIE